MRWAPTSGSTCASAHRSTRRRSGQRLRRRPRPGAPRRRRPRPFRGSTPALPARSAATPGQRHAVAHRREPGTHGSRAVLLRARRPGLPDHRPGASRRWLPVRTRLVQVLFCGWRSGRAAAARPPRCVATTTPEGAEVTITAQFQPNRDRNEEYLGHWPWHPPPRPSRSVARGLPQRPTSTIPPPSSPSGPPRAANSRWCPGTTGASWAVSTATACARPIPAGCGRRRASGPVHSTRSCTARRPAP